MADKPKIPTIDLSALSDISSVVTGMQNPDLNTKNGYFEISLTKIREDAEQPRREFEETSIEELARSIEENGLKQPIAIRNDPERAGNYIVCQGARRLRAYRLMGWKKIPAVFDPKFSRAGQVIENIQRQALTPSEIAGYVKDELAAGKSIRQIAKGLGKSPAYVFLYKNLLDIKPEPLKRAWDSGKIKDILVLNDLLHLAKTREPDVVGFVDSVEGEITRPLVKELKDARERGDEGAGAFMAAPGVERGKKREDGAAVRGRVSVFVEYQGEEATLLVKEIPSKRRVAIRLKNGQEREVSVQEISLLRVATK